MWIKGSSAAAFFSDSLKPFLPSPFKILSVATPAFPRKSVKDNGKGDDLERGVRVNCNQANCDKMVSSFNQPSEKKGMR